MGRGASCVGASVNVLPFQNRSADVPIIIFRERIKYPQIIFACKKFIDILPGNIFNRLTGRFDALGMEFIFNLNSAIEKKKLIISRDNSNILNYLCWNATETF